MTKYRMFQYIFFSIIYGVSFEIVLSYFPKLWLEWCLVSVLLESHDVVGESRKSEEVRAGM